MTSGKSFQRASRSWLSSSRGIKKKKGCGKVFKHEVFWKLYIVQFGWSRR